MRSLAGAGSRCPIWGAGSAPRPAVRGPGISHSAAALVHHGDDVSGAAPRCGLDEVGVHRRYPGAADDEPLQPSGLNEPPRRFARRVGEHAAEGSHPLGLGAAAVRAKAVEGLFDGGRIARCQTKAHGGHHLITRHRCGAVPHGQLVTAHLARPRCVAHHGPVEYLREIRRVGPRVHGHRAARGTGNARAELQTGEPRGGRALHGPGERCATPAPQRVGTTHRDGRQTTGKANDQPPESRVIHDEVGPLAHHGHRCIATSRPGQRLGHTRERGADGQRVGGAAHPDTGERGEWHLFAYARGGLSHRGPRECEGQAW